MALTVEQMKLNVREFQEKEARKKKLGVWKSINEVEEAIRRLRRLGCFEEAEILAPALGALLRKAREEWLK